MTIKTRTRLDAVKVGSASVYNAAEDKAEEIPCDAVVLAIGVYTDHSLRDELEARFDKVVELGDVSKVGKIMTATRDGYDRVKTL